MKWNKKKANEWRDIKQTFMTHCNKDVIYFSPPLWIHTIIDVNTRIAAISGVIL